MIGINLFCGGMLGIFFLNYLSQGRVYRLLEFDSEKIMEGHQYYRLITFGLLHGGLVHLIGNLLVIWNILSPFFQHKLSFPMFLIIFVISTVVTGVALLLRYSGKTFTFVGSSVGFYAFFGLMFVYYWNQGGEVFLSTLSQGPFYSNGLIWSMIVFFLGSLVT